MYCERIACLSLVQLPSEPVWVEVVGRNGWLEVLLLHGRTPWAIFYTHLSRVHAAFLRLASIRERIYVPSPSRYSSEYAMQLLQTAVTLKYCFLPVRQARGLLYMSMICTTLLIVPVPEKVLHSNNHDFYHDRADLGVEVE